MGQREACITIATAATGGGKTHETCHFIEQYIKPNPLTGWKGEKVLIYDVNGEYEPENLRKFGVTWTAPVLALKDLVKFTQQSRVEVRRILPLNPDNSQTDDIKVMLYTLDVILKTYRNGMLLLEDYNAYLVGSQTQRLISSLTRTRHKNLDLFIHLQSLAAIETRMWQNVTYIRYHRQVDDIDRYAGRITNPSLFYIAAKLVDLRCKKLNTNYFYCMINIRKNLITGQFSQFDFKVAILSYIMDYPSIISTTQKRYGGAIDARDRAEMFLIDRYMQFYGNTV